MGEAPNHRDAEERAQFMLRMRARGVGDIRLLRALERAPRALFMPQRYADIAARDIALPIGCGQTAPPPSIVAAMIQTLDVKPGARVLEIGGGTGYASSLLAQMAGEILSLERCQTLAVEAAERLSAFGLRNVEVAFADGFGFRSDGREFDRILVHAVIDAPASPLIEMLAPEGALVGVVVDDAAGEQRIVRLTRDAAGRIDASAHGPARTFMPLVKGLARAL
jgi:protein-L-isoaspartate(D-aspartate) O-methyltransferase